MSLSNRISGNGNIFGNANFSIVPPFPIVSGGTLTSDSTYYYRTFLGNGTLTVANNNLTADILMVAGGGGGGSNYYDAGGGGAGGLIHLTSTSIEKGSHEIIIGAGGSPNVKGNNTTFNNLTAIGGGRGFGFMNGHPSNADGGSGGGAGYFSGSNHGLGTTGQGNDGGTTGSFYGSPGNGGGAGTAGYAGGGGDGLQFLDFASATGTGNGNERLINDNIITLQGYYAGGGSGAGYHFGAPGLGGGGAGGGQQTFFTSWGWPLFSERDANGVANTGGGGGGDNQGGYWYDSGSGGSGLVIVRYTKESVGG